MMKIPWGESVVVVLVIFGCRPKGTPVDSGRGWCWHHSALFSEQAMKALVAEYGEPGGAAAELREMTRLNLGTKLRGQAGAIGL
jgi:hypothetical protein